MSPKMMRQFWSLVEMTQANIPLGLDDQNLTQWLLRKVRSERSIDSTEAHILSDYIQARLPLIRDLAYERQLSC